MKGDNIYPVSSRTAYRASRVLNEKALSELLTGPDLPPWLIDFAKEAFATRWKKCISDPEEMKDAAKDLWDESCFNSLQEGVIQFVQSRSVNLVLKSTIEKTLESSVMTDEFLGSQIIALTKNIQNLLSQIKNINSNNEVVSLSEKRILNDVQAMQGMIATNIKCKFDVSRGIIKEQFEELFNQGVIKQAEQFNDNEKRIEIKKILDISLSTFKDFCYGIKKGSGLTIIDPKLEIIRFRNKSESKELVSLIAKTAEEVLAATNYYTSHVMNQTLNNIQVNISGRVQEAINLNEKINHGKKCKSVSIKLKLPEFESVILNLSAGNIFDQLVVKRTEPKEGLRRKDFIVGGIFDIQETYMYTEDYWELNLNHVKEIILAGIDQIFTRLDESIADIVESSVDPRIDSYLSVLADSFENSRKSRIQECREKEDELSEKEDLVNRLVNIKSKMPLQDLRDLKDEVANQCAV